MVESTAGEPHPGIQSLADFTRVALQRGLEHSVSRADDALYLSKQNGRDRIEVARRE